MASMTGSYATDLPYSMSRNDERVTGPIEWAMSKLLEEVAGMKITIAFG